jgi:hypothetical protein
VKRFAALAVLLLMVMLLPARAQPNADDQYLVIYSLIQQADLLNNAGRSGEARARFVEAQNELRKFQKVFPDWNPKIVNFRLDYLAVKIAELSPAVPAVAPGGTPPIPAIPPGGAPPPVAPAAPIAVPPSTGADFEARLQTFAGAGQRRDNGVQIVPVSGNCRIQGFMAASWYGWLAR